MSTLDTTKKPVRPLDWHRADIKAALEKKGWSLRSLSIANDYEAGSLSAVLHKPWPKAEQLVAEAIGIPAQRIWPSRYRHDGKPKSSRGERGLGRSRTKRSTGEAPRNGGPRAVHSKGAS